MKKKVFVACGASYYRAVDAFGPMVDDFEEFIKDTSSFSMVLFTGGADISPDLYGDVSPRGICGPCWAERDEFELKVYEHALAHGIKMVGICRGLQLLTALSGGKLIHHVPNHAGTEHEMLLPVSWNKKDKIIVNSLHHQMCLPTKDSYVMGSAPKRIAKDIYIGNKDSRVEWSGSDVEAMYFPKIKAFGVQWHPEMMERHNIAYEWFNYMVGLLLFDEEMLASFGKVEKEFSKSIGDINGL